ncbi:chromatin assembly factor 1 subunit B [Angomonas deanei]|nr:chromatin assembly factor 1 subunit B [Angomonas deanei]|eukprot:EPY39589.1 chromatin assembly factor 1 subunit B [Angomonas deanei]
MFQRRKKKEINTHRSPFNSFSFRLTMNTSEAIEQSCASPLRVRTLELLWHCNERNEEAEMLGMQGSLIEGITSIDINYKLNRVATTGGDANLRIWSFNENNIDAWLSDATVDMSSCCTHVCSMRPSWMPTNARWSPQGEMLASCHCDGKICLWWRDASEKSSEVWKDFRHLSGHIHDVYDVCFSSDSRYLISAGSDGSVVVHNLDSSSYPAAQLSEVHSKFCRGVAWDPWNRIVTSFGAGPSLLCYTHVHRPDASRRGSVLVQKKKCDGDYIGESCSLSFRRPAWSPDGSLLAVPYGKISDKKQVSVKSIFDAIDAKKNDAPVERPVVCEEEEDAFSEGEGEADEDKGEWFHCVNLYTRDAVEKMAGRLVVRGTYEIRGVRWAPCFLEPLQYGKRSDSKENEGAVCRGSLQLQGTPAGKCSAQCASEKETGAWGPSDYRMVLATWTSDAVIVYTTDSSVRHSDFTDLHMRSITDVAWSNDAKFLYTTALDGYVSVISFGDSLTVAHRLPTFSAQPVTTSICQILSQIEADSIFVETSRRPKENDTTADHSQPVVVVKKKKKPDPAGEANVAELATLTIDL